MLKYNLFFFMLILYLSLGVFYIEYVSILKKKYECIYISCLKPIIQDILSLGLVIKPVIFLFKMHCIKFEVLII